MQKLKDALKKPIAQSDATTLLGDSVPVRPVSDLLTALGFTLGVSFLSFFATLVATSNPCWKGIELKVVFTFYPLYLRLRVECKNNFSGRSRILHDMLNSRLGAVQEGRQQFQNCAQHSLQSDVRALA